MLDRLPSDLSLTILREWLPNRLKHLSCLDLAYGSQSKRQIFLVLIQNKLLNLQSDEVNNVTKTAARCINFLVWLSKRHVWMPSLLVNASVIMHPSVSYSELHLPTVKTLTLYGSKDMIAFIQDHQVHEFCGLFPSLTALDVSRWIVSNEDVLISIAIRLECLHIPLRSLILSRKQSIAVTCFYMTYFANTLEVIDCWYVLESSLQVLSRCPRLLTLKLRCLTNIQVTSIVELCQTHPLLEILELFGDQAPSQASLKACESIAVACPRLRDLTWTAIILINPGSIFPVFLAHCKKFQHLWIKGQFEFTVMDRSTCELRVFNPDTACSLLQQCPLTIRSLEISNQALTYEVIAHINALDIAQLSIPAPHSYLAYDARPLLQLLACCQHLHTLQMTDCRYLTDGMLSEIAAMHFPALRSLTLQGALLVSDSAFSKLFQKLSPTLLDSQLEEVGLRACHLVDEQTLLALAACSSRLQRVDLVGTSITASSVLRVLLAAPRHVGRYKMSHGVSDEVCRELFKLGYSVEWIQSRVEGGSMLHQHWMSMPLVAV